MNEIKRNPQSLSAKDMHWQSCSRKQKWRDNMKNQNGCQEYIKELGQKIKIYRIMNEMSQQDLEDKSGVSKRSISRLEQEEAVQVDNLFKI